MSNEKAEWERDEFSAAVAEVSAAPFDVAAFKEKQAKSQEELDKPEVLHEDRPTEVPLVNETTQTQEIVPVSPSSSSSSEDTPQILQDSPVPDWLIQAGSVLKAEASVPLVSNTESLIDISGNTEINTTEADQIHSSPVAYRRDPQDRVWSPLTEPLRQLPPSPGSSPDPRQESPGSLCNLVEVHEDPSPTDRLNRIDEVFKSEHPKVYSAPVTSLPSQSPMTFGASHETPAGSPGHTPAHLAFFTPQSIAQVVKRPATPPVSLDELLGDHTAPSVPSSPVRSTKKSQNLLCSDEEDSIDETCELTQGKAVPGRLPQWADYPEANTLRPVAEGVGEHELVDRQRRTIYVLHKGEVNIVSWDESTPSRDVREAILCACDSIADSGFLMRELVPLSQRTLDLMIAAGEEKIGGRLIQVEYEDSRVYFERGNVFEFEDFHRLENNKLYFLELSRERDDLKSIIGDRFRRLMVPIQPFQHVEAQKAILRMRRGSNLLKYTTMGCPHLRHFQLSPDLRRLVWYSAVKSRDQTVVHMSNISEIKVGSDESPKTSGIPGIFTFTLVAGRDGTYTLAAKDEAEFDLWVAGLKAVACWSQGQTINKAQLLSHSRRFRQAVANRDLSMKIDDKKEISGFSLIENIKLTGLKRGELLKRELDLRKRLKTAREDAKVIDIDELVRKRSAEKSSDKVESAMPQSAAGAALFVEDATDEQMEYKKMEELIELVGSLLAEARGQFETLGMKALDMRPTHTEEAPPPEASTDENRTSLNEDVESATNKSASYQTVGKILWKAEVDLENIEDILKRLSEPPPISFSKIWNDVNQNFSSLKSTVSSWVQTHRSSILPMFFSASDPAPPTATTTSVAAEPAPSP